MSEERSTHTEEQEKERASKGNRPPWWKRLWGWTEFGTKSGWQWLELLSALAIPVVLAAAGLWFTAQQDARQQAIEDQRAESERHLEDQRTQDEALQAYLDQMSRLLIETDLRASEGDSEVRTLARARTITVLAALDASRKTQVIQFLIEADLVQKREAEGSPIISLERANLRGANVGTDLMNVPLYGANLRGADLYSADLHWVNLNEANLYSANLNEADLFTAQLMQADLTKADLSKADLSNALLVRADLSEADLSEADLSKAVFLETNLRGADLSGVEGITREQLEEYNLNLEGATMPDGSKHP